MKIKIFTNRLFIGCYGVELLMSNKKSLAIGTLLNIKNKEYCITSISLLNPSLLLLEVC
ncbi:hypothetical protein NRS6186_11475 [Bacillus subtilis]|nr:hypothetical protein L609_000900000110 [Bacillus subtilis J22]CAF1772753.1 hypothetical protein NRS6103_03896 [Bacillus subtilis]CAF1844745.1 hypothetical protein NRS6127_03927 [Bacillus subtilis]CAF1898274.1 hypothetical protein NRS6186_03900 [Bacillus subtilis]CAI6274088.1 hypothetical protein NRS6127_11375 [Bacillus subtilis]